MKRIVLLLAAAGAAVLLAAGGALAAATVLRGGTIQQVSVAYGDTIQNISLPEFTDITGASTTISVPKRKSSLIMARFSAEGLCLDSAGSNQCTSMRILAVNDVTGEEVEMEPAAGKDFYFAGDQSWHAYSIDRPLSLEEGGSYTVKVQGSLESPLDNFMIDDWSLTVEQAKGR